MRRQQQQSPRRRQEHCWWGLGLHDLRKRGDLSPVAGSCPCWRTWRRRPRGFAMVALLRQHGDRHGRGVRAALKAGASAHDCMRGRRRCWTPMPDVIVYVTMMHAIEDKGEEEVEERVDEGGERGRDGGVHIRGRGGGRLASMADARLLLRLEAALTLTERHAPTSRLASRSSSSSRAVSRGLSWGLRRPKAPGTRALRWRVRPWSALQLRLRLPGIGSCGCGGWTSGFSFPHHAAALGHGDGGGSFTDHELPP